MTPQLTTAIVLLVLAGGLMIWAERRLRTAREICGRAKAMIDDANNEIIRIGRGATFGDIRPLRFEMMKSGTFASVYAACMSVDSKHETYVIIKRFDYGDDPDFALLEAHELLDHLNEK